MSGLNEQNARVQLKYTTLSGDTPTIAPSTDHTDGNWNATDIYVGEVMINAATDAMWFRSLNGIIPITSGTTYIDNTAYVNKSGGTMTGGLITPSLSATSISATTIYSPSFNGTFIGDGSGLTGITSTIFTGGTISGPTTFTSDVDLCGAAVTVETLSGCGGTLSIISDLEVFGAISATTFYGSAAGLTDLPSLSGITLDEVLTQGDTSANGNIQLTNGDITLDNGVFYGDGSGLTNIPSSPVPTLDAVLTAGNVSDDYDILLTNGNIVLGNGIFYGDGSGLTNIGAASDIYVTGGTYDNSTGTATFSNTSGGTFQVTGFTTGSTSSFTGYTYIQEDVSLQSLALSGASTIIFDIEDFNYKNYTQRDSNLLNSQIEDKLNGDTTNITQGILEGGAGITLNSATTGGTLGNIDVTNFLIETRVTDGTDTSIVSVQSNNINLSNESITSNFETTLDVGSTGYGDGSIVSTTTDTSTGTFSTSAQLTDRREYINIVDDGVGNVFRIQIKEQPGDVYSYKFKNDNTGDEYNKQVNSLSSYEEIGNGSIKDTISIDPSVLSLGTGIVSENTSTNDKSSIAINPTLIELKTESDLEDRLILQTQSDTNIVRSITIPSDANTYYLETSNIFQNETIITNSEYTFVETKNAIDPKHEVIISQPNTNDTQSLRQQFVNYIHDEVTDGVNISFSEITVESILHSVQGGEGQTDYIQINNDGVKLSEVEGSSYTDFIVNNDNGFYQSQFQSTGISKGVSKTNFRSVQTTNDTITSVVWPLSDLEIETGAIGVKATVTALNSDEDTAYVAELYAAVRINSYAPTIFGGVDKLEKTEFTTATATIEIESSNLAIRVTGEAATTIKWSVKYELIYSVN